MTRQARYFASHPWARFLHWARRRCSDTKGKWFRYYGARGITCTLTIRDVREAWERDGADKMRRPSLDRMESTGNYERGNIRFIEFDLNSRLAWDKSAGTETWKGCSYGHAEVGKPVVMP